MYVCVVTGPETGLRLHSASLLSKWGFNDGDVPDTVYDLLDEHGIDPMSVDWRSALQGLVRDHLLPVLDQDVEVYEIGGTHNPIRASSVDGFRSMTTATMTTRPSRRGE